MSLIEHERRVHFVGIGGIGMSGLAEILLSLGHRVTGSDSQESDAVRRLRELGAIVQIGHSDDVLTQHPPEVLVYSTAIRSENPELRYAREHQVPVIRRAEMLAELMRLKRGIAVAGSHGKTTTTGLLALMLRSGGLDPTVAIGGRFDAIGSNAVLGSGAWMVAEADESDGSFLRLSPELAILTNIDREHLDHYQDLDHVLQAFEEFLDRIPFYGRAILCSDCPNLKRLAPRLNKPCYWYGFDESNHPQFLIKILKESPYPQFVIIDQRDPSSSREWLRVTLSVPGRHNVLNATAAALLASELGLSDESLVKTLSEFKGVRRRFEFKGRWNSHDVIEDYAHHPTEIRATLSAALSVYAPLKPIVVFQPHRFSRTRDLWDEFSTCFDQASQVYVLPTYAASELRESWTSSYDRENFVSHLEGVPSHFVADFNSLTQRLKEDEKAGHVVPGAPLFVLGAGDVNKWIPKILQNPS